MHELAGQKASIAQGIIVVFRLFVSGFWTLENDMSQRILYLYLARAQTSKLFDVNRYKC